MQWGAVEAAGLRLAILATLVRLLEVKAAELEGSDSGTGPLEGDIHILEASAAKGARLDVQRFGMCKLVCFCMHAREALGKAERCGPAGGPQLPRQLRDSVIYRAGQKRLARGWLQLGRTAVMEELQHMQKLLQG